MCEQPRSSAEQMRLGMLPRRLWRHKHPPPPPIPPPPADSAAVDIYGAQLWLDKLLYEIDRAHYDAE